MPELTQEQALKLLINAVLAAQSKGVFTLEEAALLHVATQVFTKKAELEDASAKPTIEQ